MRWLNFFKICCKAYAILFCFTETYLLLFPMFMLAWSSGTMECTMRINMYGEAFTEMVFWGVGFPFIAYGAYLILRSAFDEECL
jgi:hypothetical protein